ncbi:MULTISPECIES: preprotein translocase subunit SecA [unclassified Fibrobacter]|uniref:preprotein translocase subunit SecA n=1 Tax=unclassified Fibrobacter TaxID=2634177 RepID=UPI000D6BFB7C|nr:MULTISPECIES: preprotein translocase subunit SecA [unclassified Fibrobacter]PWJ63355.1 protein translocase subunit secA [Fibrobacter sp. UWR4]PZW68290.1 protein translocase subunit secA [Fibrobacter sp. UWR1]
MSIIDTVLHKVFGTPHERKVKQLRPVIAEINKVRESLESLDDAALAAKSAELREKLKNGSTLDDIKVEAFAVCKEACDRRLGIFNIFKPENNFDFSQLGDLQKYTDAAKAELESGKNEWEVYMPAAVYAKVRELYPNSVKPFRMMPFDVQMIGGLVLHEGAISEMATGEGKTLAAALPVYLNALSGKGVHVVTVNDYLAGRDAKQMGMVYKFLGLTVGLIVNGLDPAQRRESYNSDVTYGTNNEFGFDYLRDNMAVDPSQLVQRELNFCIVDEVDSILIDEARTPLIISGPAEDATDKYAKANEIAKKLVKNKDFGVDEKDKVIQLTSKGVAHIEEILQITNLYGEHADWVHFIDQALKAWHIYTRDVDYIVRDGEIIIVDENTGRLMEGRRYSNGMHQAIEAKENVQIRRENQTLATITFQNYFRMYNKLSGMTGTAETEATEFIKIYNMNTWVIPTNKPCVRQDLQDLVYKTEDEKWKAIVNEIKERHAKGQPLLVGTASIEKSEHLHGLLEKEGIPHEVLNAKNHGREAEIIQYAGHKGKVTIATNMAGRGTDIALGEGVTELGGLHVLGTERHESRRIDNQLRGRSGRQGDNGSSQYFLSLDDNLMRIFGGNNVKSLMTRFGVKDDEVITHPIVSRSIRSAQRRVEGQSFDIRKHLLDYDNVMNEQRKVIYGLRRRILNGEDIREEIMNRIEDACDIKVSQYIAAKSFPEEWKLEDLHTDLQRSMSMEYNLSNEDAVTKTPEIILQEIIDMCKARYDKLSKIIPDQDFRQIERRFLLMTIDQVWKEHLYAMDQLKDAIRFHGYAQKDPLMVYKSEGFKMFEGCMEKIATLTALRILNIRITLPNGMTVSPDQIKLPTPEEIEAAKAAQAAREAAGEQAPAAEESAKAAGLAGQAASSESNAISEEQQAQAAQAESSAEAPAEASSEGAPRVRRTFTDPKVQAARRAIQQSAPKIGRNDMCWCGSGLKYKKCHGKGEGDSED